MSNKLPNIIPLCTSKCRIMLDSTIETGLRPPPSDQNMEISCKDEFLECENGQDTIAPDLPTFDLANSRTVAMTAIKEELLSEFKVIVLPLFSLIACMHCLLPPTWGPICCHQLGGNKKATVSNIAPPYHMLTTLFKINCWYWLLQNKLAYCNNSGFYFNRSYMCFTSACSTNYSSSC